MKINQKPHHKYRNIIFDIGAVLVYWNAKAVIDDVFKDTIYDLTPLKNALASDLILQYDSGKLTTPQLIEQSFIQFGCPKELMTHLLKSIPAYLQPLKAGRKMFDDVKKLGYKVYLLSNLNFDAHSGVTASSTFIEEADGVILSYLVKTVKPEPTIYQVLLNSFNLKADECLFIDDRPENIKAGQDMGIDGIICDDHDRVFAELRSLGVLPEETTSGQQLAG